jgi:hypothetical protein
VDPAKEVVGVVVEVVEEDSVVVAVVEEVVVEEAMEEVAVEEAKQQQWQPPTHLKTNSRGYHPPYFEETPSCLTHSSKNDDYTELPTSTMTT